MPYIKESAPYVVSEDVEGLLSRWSQNTGYAMPDAGFAKELSRELETTLATAVDAPVEMINQGAIKEEMEARMSESEYPIISLDRAYIDQDSPNVQGFIDVTRMVNEDFEGIGLQPRPGYPSIEEQLEALRTAEVSPITLTDDVIFEGAGALQLAERLEAVNRPVRKIIAGIGITEGIERLQEAGINVECYRTFDKVVDEICERDFFPGVPMSGRTLRDSQGKYWSAPYINPFGDAEKWASIPKDRALDVSRMCLRLTVQLWSEVERKSGLVIPTNRLPRRLKMVDGDTSVSSSLNRVLETLE
jgi:hypothetical protein